MLGLASKDTPFPAQGTEFAPAQPRGLCSPHSLASDMQGGPRLDSPFTSTRGVGRGGLLFCSVPTLPDLEAVYRE